MKVNKRIRTDELKVKKKEINEEEEHWAMVRSEWEINSKNGYVNLEIKKRSITRIQYKIRGLNKILNFWPIWMVLAFKIVSVSFQILQCKYFGVNGSFLCERTFLEFFFILSSFSYFVWFPFPFFISKAHLFIWFPTNFIHSQFQVIFNVFHNMAHTSKNGVTHWLQNITWVVIHFILFKTTPNTQILDTWIKFSQSQMDLWSN